MSKFVIATNCKIIFCRFLRNKGDCGSIKIDHNFDQKPPINQNSKTLSNFNSANSILMYGCQFEIDQNSDCSIFYVHEKHSSKAILNDCVFTGKLGKEAHHIDGKSISSEKATIHFNSCKFSSDSKSALNTKIIKANMKNQIFNYNSEDVRNQKYFKICTLISTLGIVCIADAAALMYKNKNQAKQKFEITQESFDISLINDDI